MSMGSSDVQETTEAADNPSAFSVFLIFLSLGFTSFGGPVAHLGYFRHEFVKKRRWFDERTYADIVALCQFLPGPASSQVGIGIGLSKAGLLGAIAAWLGFTLPSAFMLIAFGYGVLTFQEVLSSGVLHGLKIVAVAVVAQAVLGMAKSLTPDAPRISLAVITASIVLLFPSPLVQFGAIVLGAGFGFFFLKNGEAAGKQTLFVKFDKRLAIISLMLFFGLLGFLPVLAQFSHSQTLEVVDSFFRSGSLVFGGGHVVLPLLQAEVVPSGWVPNDLFLAGYGTAQAVPGPLFTFAAYLGAVMNGTLTGWQGGFIALGAIFLPSFLLVIGVFPFWDMLRKHPVIRKMLQGVNAVVVGLLLAALYNPVWTSAIRNEADFALGLVLFTLLVFWKLPPWLVVLLAALFGLLL